MTDDARMPHSRRVLVRSMPVVFRVLNVPMRLVLSLPASTPLGKRLMLVYVTGRKSGRHYRQPVSYVREGETLLTPGGGRWKLNLVEGVRRMYAFGDATSPFTPSWYATR